MSARHRGWGYGFFKLFSVSPAWKKVCPSANFLIKYAKKETDNALDGDSALELTSANYGRDEWWLLLDPAPVEGSGAAGGAEGSGAPGGAAGGAEGSDNEDEAVVGGGRGEHVPPDTGSPLELSGSADSSSPPSEDEDE